MTTPNRHRRRGSAGPIIGARRRWRELRQTEVRYRALVEQLPAVVYMAEFEAAGNWLYVSPQLEQILGYTPDEWIGDPTLFDRIIHPEDEPAYRAAEARSRETGAPLSTEYRMRAKDGRMVWVRDEAALVRDAAGRPLFHQGVMFDVSDRKRTERELQRLQEERAGLLDRTVEATEQARKLLAMELHDGPIQRLAALCLNVENLGLTLRRADATDPSWAVRRIHQRLVAEVDALRRIMQELRPAALDERGLESALMDHLNAVQTRSAVECTIRSTLERRLDPAQETVLFRVAQEALTNVARHATARHAWVTLRAVGGDAELTIRDDGVGFDIREMSRLARAGHFGLISMRERAETAGGTWEIASAPGEGTMVRVLLPPVTLAAAEAE